MAASGAIIVDALAARYGGTAYAVIELAQWLADDADGEVVVVTREGSLIAEGLEARSGLRLLKLPDAGRLELVRRLVWEAFRLPWLVRREGASSVVSWSGILPRSVDAPLVCFLANPLMFEGRDAGNRLRRWAARRTLRGASHILVPTRASAARAAEALAVAPEVVPWGVDHARFRPASRPGIDLVCVADFYPHKRQDVILEAWAALPPPRPLLRLIGNPEVDRGCYESVRRQAGQLGGLGELTFESGLSPDQVAEALRGARVFALASEHETFCLPVLEAQACGLPAVVRDIPVLRETGGANTTYVTGDRPEDWASAIARLIADDAAYSAARAGGLEHAARFSWEKTAEALRRRLSAPAEAAD